MSRLIWSFQRFIVSYASLIKQRNYLNRRAAVRISPTKCYDIPNGKTLECLWFRDKNKNEGRTTVLVFLILLFNQNGLEIIHRRHRHRYESNRLDSGQLRQDTPNSRLHVCDAFHYNGNVEDGKDHSLDIHGYETLNRYPSLQ